MSVYKASSIQYLQGNLITDEERGIMNHILSMNSAVGVIGGVGYEDYSIRYINTFGLLVLGYQSLEEFEEASGGSLKNLLYQEDFALFTQEDFGRHEAERIRFLKKDGSVIWTNLTYADYEVENQTWIITMRDINQLYMRERDLTQTAEEARLANVAKTEFLSRMSHDIRTPLNGIMGMLDIEERFLGDAQKQKECHEKIRVAANHLLSLVNDVLDMSRLETGRVQYAQDPVDLEDMLKNCIDISKIIASENGVSLSYEMDDAEKGRPLLGSPLHIRQIILNLMSNAIKYNNPGGYVKLSVQHLNTLDDVVTYRIICEDNGIGMSEEFLPHIFDSFSQEDASARTVYQGTGLGMAIVKKTIEEMGGAITVESKKGVGTKFTITLPLKLNANPADEEGEQQALDVVDLSGKKVLLVEDNELNMEIAQFILEDIGAIVDTAINGQEALCKFIESPVHYYDLIFMDMMMPVMDGCTATQAIREEDRADAATIPIIAMTANVFEEDKKRALDAGMNAHIAKPLVLPNLMKTIASLLQ